MAIFTSLLFSVAMGQTEIQEGEVYGTWTKQASPYLIQGEVNIPLDKTLTIEPGVMIKFNGYYKFIIYGCLIAEGAEGDSILFTTDDPETGWHALRFIDTRINNQPESKVIYCIVEYGKATGSCPDNRGAGIYAVRSDPVISNCCIRNNRVISGAGEWGGGGIYCESSAPIIKDNLICNNYSGHDGGGIYCSGSPVISHNRIINNEASMRGGGIATFLFASPDILNNEITGNQSGANGGGIYQSGGNSLIQGNIFRENYSGKGGGIASYLCDHQRLYNNLFIENEAHEGGGIWNLGSSPKVFNNTVLNNHATMMGGGMLNREEWIGSFAYYSNPLTVNNIFYFNNTNGEGSQIYSSPGNKPELWHNDIGELAGDGIFGDFDEQEGNMDVVPGFDTTSVHECALSEGSGCIDKGINKLWDWDLPETDILGNKRIWDGDNDGQAYADMGAYEYGSLPLGTVESQAENPEIALQVSPNPFSSSFRLSFQLENSQVIMISVHDLSGRWLQTLVNEKISPGRHAFLFGPENLNSDIYLLYLKTGDGKVGVKKIIKYK